MAGTNRHVNARDRVVVAMSGGVDSSVAACLLQEQGYDVMGLFMRSGLGSASPDAADGGPTGSRGCCSAADAADARRVAGRLGVPFYALNFQQQFDRIIDYFADEYARGRTPNPCVVCNNDLKFGRLLEYADSVGARFVATGHYARIETVGGAPRLRRAVDEAKDQSYVLYGIDRGCLDRVLFPLGKMTKSEVRDEARRLGLGVHEKPDSVEICFVPDDDYARVVRERRPEAFQPGDVVDSEGKVLGRHEGVPNFTIGQRRGLRIAAGRPIYVTQLNVLDQMVVVGDRADLLRRRFTVRDVNLLCDIKPGTISAQVKIRYQHTGAPALIELKGGNRAFVTFETPQSAITPGQAAVFYDGDWVIGGGWIDEVDEEAAGA